MSIVFITGYVPCFTELSRRYGERFYVPAGLPAYDYYLAEQAARHAGPRFHVYAVWVNEPLHPSASGGWLLPSKCLVLGRRLEESDRLSQKRMCHAG